MKRLFVLLFCILIGNISQAQQQLSLKDVIALAQSKSIRSKQIENRYQNSYWRNFSYKKQFLPSLVFDGTLPEFQHSISSVTQNDGSETFVNRNVISSKANLSINQAVPFTGGNIFVRSGLDNIRLSGNTESTTYLSRPIEFGYSQNIFGFNQYKWDKKIEPLYFNEAQLLKSEEIEQLSVESVNRYFDLLRDQLSMENAENNFLNNDTIYKIGKGRYGYGKIAENELLQLELSLLNAEMSYEREKLNFELSRQKFPDAKIFGITTGNNKLWSGGRDALLKIWKSNELVAEIKAHNLHINSLDYNLTNKLIISGSMDKSVKIWNSKTHQLLKVLNKDKCDFHISSVNKVLWIGANEFISCGDDRKLIHTEIDYTK